MISCKYSETFLAILESNSFQAKPFLEKNLEYYTYLALKSKIDCAQFLSVCVFVIVPALPVKYKRYSLQDGKWAHFFVS